MVFAAFPERFPVYKAKWGDDNKMKLLFPLMKRNDAAFCDGLSLFMGLWRVDQT